MDFGLWVMDFGSWVMGFTHYEVMHDVMQMGYGLWIKLHGLWVMGLVFGSWIVQVFPSYFPSNMYFIKCK